MKVRTCPHCGEKYPGTYYYENLLWKFSGFSNGTCDQCGKTITFSLERWIMISIVAFLPLVFILPARKIQFSYFSMIEEISFLLFLIGVMIWWLVLLHFDTFKPANSNP